MDDMIIVSTDNIVNKNIEKYLGFISAEVVLGTGVISETFTGIADVFGTESTSFDKKINKAKEDALKKLSRKCVDLDGNAIIGTKYDIETIGKNMIMAVISGTAVYIEK